MESKEKYFYGRKKTTNNKKEKKKGKKREVGREGEGKREGFDSLDQ